MALDREILFFDETSAALDPISSSLLDDLILELRDRLGATVVVVTHELAGIFAIGNNCVFLDADSRVQIATSGAIACSRSSKFVASLWSGAVHALLAIAAIEVGGWAALELTPDRTLTSTSIAHLRR
jgi:ABC-type transporter Mla maintaining outer membrane lipid asymmetry ATPase subunit MlaF